MTNGDLGTFTITYKAIDQFGVTSTATRTVERISNQIPHSVTLSNTKIDENTTAVGTISATDPEGASLTFRIAEGGGEQFFEIINGNQLVFLSAPDFEDSRGNFGNNVYGVTLIANDGIFDSGRNGMLIEVENVEEAPTVPTLTATSIVENTTTVGTLSSTDPEGANITYSLVDGVDTEHFSIAGSTLSFINPPDFEAPIDNDGKNTYRAKLIASDGSLNTAEIVFVIRVTDANEAPENIALSNTSVVENTTAIGTLSVSDPEGESITYRLIDKDDSDHFSITGSALSFVTPPDFEAPTDGDAGNTYLATIVANDGSVDSEEYVIAINVTDDTTESTISEFRSTYSLAADGSDDAGDLSGNGVPNIHYLAFDLGDPNEANIDRSKLPVFEDGPTANTVRITYNWRNDLGLTYEIHRSHDFGAWTAESEFAEGEEAITSLTSIGEGDSRTTSKVFPAADSACFYCIGVQ